MSSYRTIERQSQPASAQPVIIIDPARRWKWIDMPGLWKYRELLYFLSWRDVMVRYKQTLLGVTWALIQPLATMVIFTLFFGRLAKVPSDGIPYPLFAFAGLLPWTFFSNAVTTSSTSLVGNSNLITKVYFPRVLVPGAAVCASLVDFGISFAMLGVLMAWYRVPLTSEMLLLVPLTLLTTVLAASVGLYLSCLNVKYRDIRYALPFLIQLWMFASPIIYPASLVPAKWRWALFLNPVASLIEGYRSALFHRAIDWTALSGAVALIAGLLLFSIYSFQRMEREFADVL